MGMDAKLLIADADERSANVLRMTLCNQGYRPIVVSSAEQLLHMARQEPLNLIIMDVALPRTDGIELCRSLKAQEETQRIPIIIMTAPEQEEARVQGMEAGAADFLIKPVKPRELVARVKTALQIRKAVDRRLAVLLNIRDHLAKFVPLAVRRLIEENPETPGLAKQEEDISVLFVDISGFTQLSLRITREQIITLIERYFSHFLDCIQAEGGDIAELAGDGAMALFHSADPREHARQGARAALRILEVTDRLNREHPDAGTPIAVHMGLNSGHAGVGSIRLEGALGSRWTFTASGSVTNLAARLGAAAAPGTILVGQETARRIDDEFALEPIDVGELKNLPKKVEGYRLTQQLNHVETAITGVATLHASFP